MVINRHIKKSHRRLKKTTCTPLTTPLRWSSDRCRLLIAVWELGAFAWKYDALEIEFGLCYTAYNTQCPHSLPLSIFFCCIFNSQCYSFSAVILSFVVVLIIYHFLQNSIFAYFWGGEANMWCHAPWFAYGTSTYWLGILSYLTLNVHFLSFSCWLADPILWILFVFGTSCATPENYATWKW